MVKNWCCFLPGKSHGRRSLVGCSAWGRAELDRSKRLHFHFSLSYIGERNGSPLQCSCLENPRDGGAWWAAIYGVAQSRTRLKRLSSSSSRAIVKKYAVKYKNNCSKKLFYLTVKKQTFPVSSVEECVISSVLSHRSKNLKQWTDYCYSLVLFRK